MDSIDELLEEILVKPPEPWFPSFIATLDGRPSHDQYMRHLAAAKFAEPEPMPDPMHVH